MEVTGIDVPDRREHGVHIESTIADGSNLLFVSHMSYLFQCSRLSEKFFAAYSITCSANVVALILLLDPKLPSTIKSIITIPILVLQNAMACRVFRLLKLQCLYPSSDPFRLRAPSTIVPVQTVHFEHDTDQLHDSTIDTTSDTTTAVKQNEPVV